MTPPAAGDTYEVSHTFSTDDVERFAALSGDDQPRHTDPNEAGELLVHGLLTATLPTEIGGDLNVLATEMAFSFERPVYTGQAIRCTWTYDAVEERADRYEVVADVVCERDASVVLTGTVEGLVWKAGGDGGCA